MIGTLLNQYRLDEVIGQGGMGVVYRARDMNLERTVAVKVLSAAFRADPDYIARFRQEARIQAGLNHPNIATLFDFFVWNDMPVAVMELIEGESLLSMVARSGPIRVHLALPIIVQTLRGVAAGHEQGIIHRDLKPSNIMVTATGIVKITDFGIAKARRDTGLTQVSTRVGSTSYMAPEQILGRPVDERTDIYVIGGTLYELLTGRPPFQGLSQFEIDSAHVREPPAPPTQYCADIPPSVVNAVMRALAKDPSERFASADEFIQALPDLGGLTDCAEPQGAGAVHAKHAVTAFVASGLLALAVTGVVIFLARQRHGGADHRPAPSMGPAHDLTGQWTGAYVDGSGKELLHLQNLQLQQLSNGAVTGGFSYAAGGSAGDQCSLEKSNYSAQSKRLRLIAHCRNPEHPKYLNVPLDFNNVDPGASTIGGGRLAFHLADDVVVTLQRVNGV
ncbi:MAG: serine/threonine protein kinase [Proteobacteria bacterium]|nr:serine/threonine protein kinase [Pseudomonadota bacterium]